MLCTVESNRTFKSVRVDPLIRTAEVWARNNEEKAKLFANCLEKVFHPFDSFVNNTEEKRNIRVCGRFVSAGYI